MASVDYLKLMLNSEILEYSHPNLKRQIRIEQVRPGVDKLLSVRGAAAAIQRVGYEAVVDSQWLQAEAEITDVSLESLAREWFDPDDAENVESQKFRLEESARSLGRRAIYLAAFIAPEPARPFIELADVVGFAKMEQQVSGSRLQRLAKEIGGRKIYACLHDFNVRPDYQNYGIGTALAYAGYSCYPLEMRASLYTRPKNDVVARWAENLGFKMTDKARGIHGLDRYQAPSVGTVLGNIKEKKGSVFVGLRPVC